MRSCHSQPWFAFPFVAIGIAAYLYMARSGTPSSTDSEAMIGTWTDEAGEPGNSIRFYFVPVEIPGAPYATGNEGHVTLAGWLGENQAQASWNYGGLDPLVLNLVVGTKTCYAAVRKLDEDHLLIRIGADPEEMMRLEAIEHPETKRLTRIGRETGR
jgi:hypothetical protein